MDERNMSTEINEIQQEILARFDSFEQKLKEYLDKNKDVYNDNKQED